MTDSKYRNLTFDGLRAIAVISVLLYHLKVPGLEGGVVGVDIFFLLSGYLITESLIKSQSDYADYYDSYGWWGTFEVMEPLSGYMLYTNSSGNLIYPDLNLASSDDSEEEVGSSLVRDFNLWELQPSKYEYNGSITAELKLDETNIKLGDMLAAFVDEE